MKNNITITPKNENFFIKKTKTDEGKREYLKGDF